jgi:hypothetical protein
MRYRRGATVYKITMAGKEGVSFRSSWHDHIGKSYPPYKQRATQLRSAGQSEAEEDHRDRRLTDIPRPWYLLHRPPFQTRRLNAVDDETPHSELTDDLHTLIRCCSKKARKRAGRTSYNGRFLTKNSSVALARGVINWCQFLHGTAVTQSEKNALKP